MAREKEFKNGWWKTPAFWKEMKKQEKFIKKLNRAIDKKHWKDFLELTGGKPKFKKSDWL